MKQKCANCGNNKWHDGVTAITDTCIECRYVDKDGKSQPSNWKPKVSSNADRIRAMSDEELAEFLCGVFDDDECNGKYICGTTIAKYDQYNIAEWLKSPVQEE